MQKFQDWFTQQWVILMGRQINPNEVPWLIGPFGNLNGIGEDFINQLAEKENLVIERNSKTQGLIQSIHQLCLSENELRTLSQNVVDFYEKTSNYNLDFSIRWNPIFKLFGVLVSKLFSIRINQLNVPTKNIENSESLLSEIITLSYPDTNQVKYTIWLRTIKISGKIVYSGIYTTCRLPLGKTCIKAIFPLPKGNATVIMFPTIGTNGELILESSGKKFGDAGFYFLLQDSKCNYWSQFIRSFRDRLVIGSSNDNISAEQTLTLWNVKVLTLYYKIKHKIS